MKKIGLSLGILTALISPFSIATASPYVPQSTYPSQFSAYGAWLHFSPTSETTYYSVESDSDGNVNGVQSANRFDDYYPGYRVAIGYTPSFSNNYFTATWSDLKVDHSASITDSVNGVYPTIGPAFLDAGAGPFAQMSKHFHYFALDAVVGQNLFGSNFFNLSLFGGLHYAKLISRESYEYVSFPGVDGFIDTITGGQISDFWGIGPQLGFNATLPIWRGFSVFGNASGSMLIGHPTVSIVSTVAFGSDLVPPVFTPFNANNERVWSCVPQGDLQIGLNYDFTLCNKFCFSFEVGYEALVYFSGLYDLLFPSPDTATSIEEYRNVTMHGLTLGLSVGF